MEVKEGQRKSGKYKGGERARNSVGMKEIARQGEGKCRACTDGMLQREQVG